MKPALVAMLLLTGCASTVDLPRPYKPVEFRHLRCPDPDIVATPADHLDVRYTGSGGVQIIWRGESILIGPYFTNDNAVRALGGTLRPDVARIASAMQRVNTDNIVAILAGHSHFDHLGDIAHIAATYAPRAKILTNDNGEPLLAPLAVTKFADATPVVVGQNFTITPFLGGHAPQFCLFGTRGCIVKYARGPVEKGKTTKLPHLRGGDAHVFVIQLRDGPKIYYNDSASDVAPPEARDTDLAILTMAGWHNIKGYPDKLFTVMSPRHVLVSHWEDFLVKHTDRWRFPFGLTSSRATKFLQKLTVAGTDYRPTNAVCGAKTEWFTMPVPGSQLLFRPN